MVRMAAHGAGAAPARRLRVARQTAGPHVGTTRAYHARLRAREQLVAADTRVVAAEALLLALRLALRQARVGGERAWLRLGVGLGSVLGLGLGLGFGLGLGVGLRPESAVRERACMRVQVDAPIVPVVVVAVVQHAAARRVVEGNHCVGGQVLTVRPP